MPMKMQAKMMKNKTKTMLVRKDGDSSYDDISSSEI